MATYTSETTTTTTRRYLLPLPSNTAELGKLESAMISRWRKDHPGHEPYDNSITVTVEDDVLVFSWPLPAAASTVDPEGCACGHRWAEHNFAGCVNQDNAEPNRIYCKCVVSRPTGVPSGD